MKPGPVDPLACTLALNSLSGHDICPKCKVKVSSHRHWQRRLAAGDVRSPWRPAELPFTVERKTVTEQVKVKVAPGVLKTFSRTGPATIHVPEGHTVEGGAAVTKATAPVELKAGPSPLSNAVASYIDETAAVEALERATTALEIMRAFRLKQDARTARAIREETLGTKPAHPGLIFNLPGPDPMPNDAWPPPSHATRSGAPPPKVSRQLNKSMEPLGGRLGGRREKTKAMALDFVALLRRAFKF